MKSLLLPVLTFALCAGAQEAPLWLRNTAISPDGTTIAFTYHGDIFTVPVSGGVAKQITSNSAYDTAPLWSPDGSIIVFASDREGSKDLFKVDATGGTPKRLTTHSNHETPVGFLNDSTILYLSNWQEISGATASGPFLGQTYSVNINGGRPQLYASIPMNSVSVDNLGRILYQDKKTYENAFRKHERSSGTSDIWMIDNDGAYTKLTTFNGHDLTPVWSADNEAFYYTSEQDGTLNVYKRNLQGKEEQLTKHQRHPVRNLSASRNGVLAYSWNGEIYTLTPGQEPQKVDITIISDDYDSDAVKGYRNSGASRIAVSPDGKQVAFVLRGDVYVTDTKYETTKRITNTDGQERVLSFSPDGKSLVYDSERDGMWGLYITKITSDEETFPYATGIEEELLYLSTEPAQQPKFSPDGKKVAFLEDRDGIKVIDIASKQVNTALDEKFNYSYSDGDISFEWSPDSRWLLTSYIGIGGWNNLDIALVKADGSEVINLTESGYSNAEPKWAMDGKGITYLSGRYGMKSHGSWGEQYDVILMMLDGEGWDEFNMSEEEVALKEEADKKKEENKDEKKDKKKDKKSKADKEDAEKDEVKPLEFDLANRQYRTSRLTGTSSSLVDYYLSPKGDKLYYITRNNSGKHDLMMRDLRKGDTKVIVPGIAYGGFEADKDGENLFLLSGNGIQKIALPDGGSEDVTFSAEFSRTPSAEREYMYDHVWRQINDKFYDKSIHGIDWEQYGEDYRKFLPYINNNYDFADLLSELLGELNASHTGSGYRAGGATNIATLGAVFDQNYDGDGLLVSEVIARGPLSRKNVNVEAGDIILSIDGKEIKAGEDYYPLLEGKAGKKVRIGVKKPSGAIEYSIVKPKGGLNDELYQRWVEHNEHIVDSVSGGKVGYVHIHSMDSESFREVYSKLLGKYRNHEAVVVDTRFNNGGWLHNDVALLLSGKEYVRYSPRGKYIGSDPFSQWTKPSVMLVNEGNYSDAHATPYTYQTLGIGKVVGAPVPGTMTAVWWETMIDPTVFFGVPMVTSLDRNGKPLENQQLNPDILIYNNPGEQQQGIDTQLIEATKLLMK